MTIKIVDVRAFVFRAPNKTPVQTSFGFMYDRPAVFVCVTDSSGRTGWGEVWCNFPSVGAEHRAKLVNTVFAPILKSNIFLNPKNAFKLLTKSTEVLAIQAAEQGPIAQCIAGLDIAIWDLYARNLNQPLWKLLGGLSPDVHVYASGLNPTSPEILAEEAYRHGYRAFKLKVGFGKDRDLANLRSLKSTLKGCRLMVDANQGWDLSTAIDMSQSMSDFNLDWLEEPLRADRPWSQWRRLEMESPIKLSAGENLAGLRSFDRALKARALAVIQPDIAKWGGITGGLAIIGLVKKFTVRYCPHYLGGGIGLLASAHLLSGSGLPGMLEVDSNPNPLRTLACGPLASIHEGIGKLTEQPGLGLEPDFSVLNEFLVTY